MLPRSPTSYAALVLARAGVTAADTSRATTPCPQLSPACEKASTRQSVAWSPYRLCAQHNARSVDHEPVGRVGSVGGGSGEQAMDAAEPRRRSRSAHLV